MRLVDVYTDLHTAIPLLYQLLQEREPQQSISHRKMPTYREHEDFVCSVPYMDWRLIVDDREPVGAVYLTKRREIGIAVLKSHRRKGLATQALQQLMKEHPGEILANINPANEPSIALFRSLGFDGPVQITLRQAA